MSTELLEEHVREFASRHATEIDRLLGTGQDGRVWFLVGGTVVKAFERVNSYCRELDCYKRLAQHGIHSLQGFAVPTLIRFADDLLVIEMDYVNPPYLIDFGKAYLDETPDFPPESMQEWRESTAKLFGKRWPQVRLLIAALKGMGIHYLDAKPQNIRFGDERQVDLTDG